MKILQYKKEKGIALPIALFVLVAILLASAALIRSNELAVNVAGDLSSRDLVYRANDAAAAQAMNWLTSNSITLNNDIPAQGYYSAYPPTTPNYLQPNNAVWNNALTLPADAFGNISSYLIYRMCSQPDTPYNGSNAGIQNVCAISMSNQTSNSGNSSGYNAFNFSGRPQVYFQIITKTVGSKGATDVTVSTVKLGV
jgi:Tfp pilus assembly protein PilX